MGKNIIDRLELIMHEKGLNDNKLTVKANLSVGLIGKARKTRNGLHSDSIEKILYAYPDINAAWLLTGEGSMLKESPSVESPAVGTTGYMANLMPAGTLSAGVPFYNLPVSAGHSTVDIIGTSTPDGYITSLPGAELAQAILPVIGMSMQPEIMPGALIGIRNVSSWESLNTERIYMIITCDDRMIKRIEHDPDNTDILWCISPNYQKFKIFKSDIIEIHRVCFVYNTK